jgi:hypothetical protein
VGNDKKQRVKLSCAAGEKLVEKLLRSSSFSCDKKALEGNSTIRIKGSTRYQLNCRVEFAPRRSNDDGEKLKKDFF